MIDVGHFKQKLEAEKERLLKELGSVAQPGDSRMRGEWDTKGTMNTGETISDPNEVADKIEEFETNTSLMVNFENQLQDVNAALDKIKAGTYGVCEIGGEEIEIDRLEANPSAKTCIAHMN